MGRSILDTQFGTGGALPSAKTRAALCAPGHIDKVLTASGAETGLASKDAIDLDADLNWPARDQWRRGTCTAFATAALAEFTHAKKTGTLEKFSPEFLYWCMRKEPGYMPDPSMPYYGLGATKLNQASAVLRDFGLCREASAPYVMDPAPSMRRPKAEAWSDAAAHKFTTSLYHDFEGDRPDFDIALSVYEELAAGRPVAVGLPVFGLVGNTALDNWTNSRSLSTGKVLGPVNRPDLVDPASVVSGHVVCVTGFQPDPRGAHGGWFIFRNSWNSRFNDPVAIYHSDTVPRITRRGYGAVSASHVLGYALEVLSLA